MTDPQDPAAPGGGDTGPAPPHAQQPGPHPGNPGPQYPGPQYPGPQYPGQQYAGQQYAGPQYPGQQLPGQQYPGQQWGAPPPAPKPGVIPLRPLGVGEILDGAVSYIRANPLATLGLAAIVITITQVIQLPFLVLTMNQLAGLAQDPEAEVAPATAMTAFTGTMLTILFGGLLTGLATVVLSGMLVVVLARAVTGHGAAIGEVWAGVRRRIPGLLGLTLLAGLLLGLVVAVGAAPLVVGLVVFVGSGTAGIIGGLVLVVAFGGAVWLGVSWSLAAPAYVLEGIPVIAALRRSFRLVRNAWWRVFGILLLGGLIAGVISTALSWPFSLVGGLIGGVAADPFGGALMISLVLSGIGTIVATSVTAPFSAGITGLLYIDQRIRREALDLELARAAQR